MILKEDLREVVRRQRAELDAFEAAGVEREKLAEIDLASPFATVVSGIRRCGKSTLLKQLAKRKPEPFYYFYFEDTRIAGFGAGDFEKLDEVFREEFGERGLYFLDEIQNVENWELFVRSRLDRKKRFAITGSNASLLSRELGTRLTGRHLQYELFPFSYRETLAFLGKKPGEQSFWSYLENGGFPEYLKQGCKTQILQQLFNDIIERDIVARHKLRNSKTIKELALFLLSNSGKEFSFNSLKKTLQLGSVNTAISFVSYLEDSYLVFTVQRFDYSLKKQLIEPKKAYAIDTGMTNANTASASPDKGRLLENAVFLHLRRHFKEINYYKKENECDFIAKEKNKPVMAVQACLELNQDNLKRETAGLLEAMKELKLGRGLIITLKQEDEINADGKKLQVKPAWKWMQEKP